MDGTGDLFQPFVSSLDRTITTLVVRYPTTEVLGYDELICYVRDLLPRDEPFFLLGESFSGPIAISLAAEEPQGLQGLVLCASFLSNPIPGLRGLCKLASAFPIAAIPTSILALALFGRFSTPYWRIELAKAIKQVTPDVLRARMRAVLDIDVTEAASRLKVPVVYLQGTEDRVVPANAGHHIHKLVPGLSLEKLEAPHMLLQVANLDAALAVQKFIALADRCVS
jgi:pimeloyl-ACP methyl ester carboxylesterase